VHGNVTPDPVRELLERVERQAYMSGLVWGKRAAGGAAFWRGFACGVVVTLVAIAWGVL
jgi:hypothetical protein